MPRIHRRISKDIWCYSGTSGTSNVGMTLDKMYGEIYIYGYFHTKYANNAYANNAYANIHLSTTIRVYIIQKILTGTSS